MFSGYLVRMGDSVIKWRLLFKSYAETLTPALRYKNFSFIDEEILLEADALIFDLKSYRLQISSANLASKVIESVAKLEISDHPKNEEKTEKKIPPKPEQPEEPGPDECCGSGCRVCVFDLYYQKLE